MAEIDSLKNKNDDIVLPRTVTEAVFDSTSGEMLNIVLESLRGNNDVEDYSTSGDGYWIKFKNGLIIQAMLTRHEVVVNTPWGELFSSDELQMGNWPVPMVEAPFSILTLHATTSFIQHSMNGVTGTSGGKLYVTRPQGSSSSYPVRFYQLAFGRWK